MPGRKWTPQDDANLRRFHAEGADDKTLGYILGWWPQTVRKHRRLLGLKCHGKPGAKKGFKHTEAFKAWKREDTKRQWRENAAFREAALAALAKNCGIGLKNRWATAWKAPADPAERRYYKKLQRHLGTPAARQAIGSPQRPVQRFHEPA